MEMATAEELEWLERETEMATAEEHFSPKMSSKRTRQDQEEEEWLRYSPHPPQPRSSKRGRPLHPQQQQETEEIRISRFASDIQGHCIPITGPAGHRVYAKLNSTATATATATATVAPLLPQSIHTLNQRLENNAFSKALHHSLESIGTHRPPPPPEALQTEQLWVDKYAPTSFTDLLSHEHTNREVLLWLKQWDSLVFGSQVRTTSDDVLSALRIHSSVTHTSKFASNRGFFSKHHRSNVQNINSATETGKSSGPCASHNNKCLVDKPPEQKVLLLCGPPGLGKTTLAHVVAKHCGYRVVEINASDDRSASSIEAKILDVVQMNSVMPDSKPKCLVIDEIDGALGDGKGAVEVILKMVAAERRGSSEKRVVDEETEGQAQPQKASSKKRHRVAKLSRPIICICNDLYAPALRQLRQVAKVHTFMQPTVNRVVNRLKYICMKEGFRTNSIALSALAECTECDIRSCLNTLQFLNKKQQPLSIVDVDSQVIGRKDLSKSAIDIWKEVFHKKKTKHFANSVDGQVGGDDTTQHLFTLISGRGEYELTMDGIHENFLRLSYHDPMMHKTVRCLDLLETSDFLIHYVSKTQQMSIHVYQPAIAVSMSRLIAQVEKPNIEWPKSFHRCRAMLVEKQETLKSWQRRIVPSISRHLSVESFVKDVVSPFLHIITPPNLRPVALNLLSDSEKDDLHQLVDSMVAYSISYKYSKGEPGEKMQNLFADASEDLLLSLEPPLFKFINFKGYQSQHFALSIAMKQILVYEVEQQRILQESSRRNADCTEDKTRLTAPQPLTAALANAGKYDKKAAVLEFDEELRLKVEASPGSTVGLNLASHKPSHCNPSFNFFHRFRKESSANTKSQMAGTRKAATTERDLRPLLFKYNEGFTNAVKRPLKIRDLLL
ncbi:hypothetical protein LUZ63_004565 [Rhynchospora breviuscula]|uniref:Chromosome transmission fidelity protein 18 homolog n=1 Tax=Rhynchospora breviuscula TaxID=2022672 RepID=A0A9Q0CLC4_9POAL|nr:hypothetical protein LUZ63_004565 [Rhynchospora breviuscula]